MLRLLQLLTGYVRQAFDVLLDEQQLNQLKVCFPHCNSIVLLCDKVLCLPTQRCCLQLVRFWAQHVVKLVNAFHGVRHSIWSSLATLLAHMHAHMPPFRCHALYSAVCKQMLLRIAVHNPQS